jgi:hypothetical protein
MRPLTPPAFFAAADNSATNYPGLNAITESAFSFFIS